MGPCPVLNLEEEVVRRGEGSAGAGWSQPLCLFAFQASQLLRSLDLGLAPVPAFAQPEAHRALVPGSWQLGESGCGARPAARRQKRALCVGTRGPVPLGARWLPPLPSPDESSPQKQTEDPGPENRARPPGWQPSSGKSWCCCPCRSGCGWPCG